MSVDFRELLIGKTSFLRFVCSISIARFLVKLDKCVSLHIKLGQESVNKKINMTTSEKY